MHTPRRALCGLAACLFVLSCTWEPVVRDVQHELLFSGQYAIVDKLGSSERYVLVARLDGAAPHLSIVDLHSRKACDLPPSARPTRLVLGAPADHDEDDPELIVALSMLVEGRPAQLAFSDLACKLRGPYGALAGEPYSLIADGDGRSLVLWGDGAGTLSLLDPWSEDKRVIATGVADYVEVSRPLQGNAPVGEQALWLIENGELVQRTLTGKKLFARGHDVTEFDDAAFDTSRVAFIAGGALYEAAGPRFSPVRIRDDACSPFYQGTTLNLYSPCAARQLVRLDLTTGAMEEFAPGVYWLARDSGVLVEYASDGQPLLYVTPPEGKRTRVTPTLHSVQVLDTAHIAGLSPERTFGIWGVTDGFQPLFRDVEDLDPYVDLRSNTFLWLMLHEERDGIGRLSVFSGETFTLQDLGARVPVNRTVGLPRGFPAPIVVRINGYSVEVLDDIPEPIVISIEGAKTGSSGLPRGKLFARFLSGDLESQIDEDVTSYEMIALPLAGLLYTIDDGPRRGLWFAAL